MRIQDEVAGVVKSVLEQHEIKRVIWIAAGGSFGGHWAANYFLQRESKTIPTEMHTSNEFVFATPPYVDEHCLCVLTPMRGTPETLILVSPERLAFMICTCCMVGNAWLPVAVFT